MYLKSLTIKNFRAIKETTIEFNKGLNILIGPNNSGKTTIIDALRICLSRSDNPKNVKKDDFYKTSKKLKNKSYSTIEFHLSFSIDDEFEKALFVELYNLNNNSLDIHYNFNYDIYQDKIEHTIYGGENKDNPISNDIFNYMKNIYLGALRDANRFLTPGRQNILSSFFSELVSEEDKEEMMNEINEMIVDSKLSKFISNSNNHHIQNQFKEMTFDNEEIMLSISPIDQDFDIFTRNLKIQLPFGDSNYLELYQNGLGYNNLIYISVLLGHLDYLINTEKNKYTSLCIEEPEAHLHPQLQNSFFRYLNTINKITNLQLFITSHSPTLTSKADLNSLILVQNNGSNVITHKLIDSFPNVVDQNFLKKFLDVTKSQLLFSKKVIFVEGISEAILIPTFAKICDFDLDKNGVEIVNVQGLGFKHFAPLFDSDNPLISKGVILTDDDRDSVHGGPSETCMKIKSLENDKLKVFCAEKTFEFDLICADNFNPVVWEVFKEKHPIVFGGIIESSSLFDIFNSERKYSIKKADIALILSEKLNESNHKDIVPNYIKDCFNFLKG